MKEDASLQNHFKKGISTLVALSLLQNQRMYGYELVQTMEKVSGGRFVLQEGTLYPILYRLVDQGIIESERVMVGRRMSRVYYQITPKGVEYLAKIRQEYEDITAGVAALLDYRPPGAVAKPSVSKSIFAPLCGF